MTRTRRKIHDSRPFGLAILAALLAGCATVPPPIQMMDHAQMEIRAARNAGAATTAPDALGEAERRLAAAQQFSANGDNGKAADKATEAEAAAATARARAEAAKLDRQIDQQTQVNAGLQVDLERRQAAAAAAQQAVTAPPAAASSSGNGPVDLPAIQLGQPAPGSSAGEPAPASTPAPAGTDGQPESGVSP
jgi:hypothetical protein